MMLKTTLFLFLTLFGWGFVQENDYVFQKDSQKIELKIENDAKYIYWDTKTRFSIKTENINQKQLVIIAPNLRILKPASEGENEGLWEITAEKMHYKNDTLSLFVSYRRANETNWHHTFKILIR